MLNGLKCQIRNLHWNSVKTSWVCQWVHINISNLYHCHLINGLPHIQPTCAGGLYLDHLLSRSPTFRMEHYFQIFRLEVCLVYNWVNERKKINDVVGVGIMCSHFRQGDCHYWIILWPPQPSHPVSYYNSISATKLKFSNTTNWNFVIDHLFSK